LAESKKSSAPWAGEFYAGDGLGVNQLLVIAPKSGFVFEWHGCLGLYDRNYGRVAWTNNAIHLSFTFSNQTEGFQGMAPQLVPVPWGKRMYLVPADDLIGFCNEVNQGNEPRSDVHGLYLLGRGHEKRAVAGYPEVPKEFRSYLLSKPVVTEIVGLGFFRVQPNPTEWTIKDTPVILNAGSKEGLRVGMQLLVLYPTNIFVTVRITGVEETKAEAVMSKLRDGEPDPQVGWRVTTWAPWNKSRLVE
jgi:hypothetical protein